MEIKRCYDTIIGASVGENQLVQSGATSVTVQSGHKYYAKIDGTESLGTSTGSAITINDSAKDMVIDLSLYLPANIVDYIYQLETATAGAGIAKLREWGFLRGYHAYNAGSIESVEVTGKKVVGFNQWDEEWELGSFNNQTGKKTSTTTQIRSKNYIDVLPNTEYYGCIGSSGLFVWFYDENKNYIAPNKNITNMNFVTPPNARYACIATWSSSVTTTEYRHDICINISSDRNGEYEAYASQSYALGSDKLRGIFKLDANNNLYADGDRKTSDGTVTRKYGVVDLGTLTWVIGSTKTSDKYRMVADLAGAKYNSDATVVANAMCAKYPTVAAIETYLAHGGICINKAAAQVMVYDENYNGRTDENAFKTAMNGVYLVYELATPTTEQSTPFTSPQICYPDGTEEFITESGVPVGHETRYEL